ncbi:hypothetical protein KKA53_03015 [Candidatus Dependentiae bacterium]|nr:hypothetical protein [Candidatus Dependentiae bacterium]
MRVRGKKNLLVIAAITMLFGTLVATEFRSPLIIERGPMRYVFEEWGESDCGLKVWSSCFTRESHKAFLSHGTSTYPLSTLFFNKSCFNLSEIFPNSYVDPATQYYSPYLGVTQLKPRITYYEKGVSLGARWAHPVYKNKGRVGLRIQVPFRSVEIEREDHGDKDTNQLDDLMTGEIVDRAGTPAPATDVYARAIRLDFLQSLPYQDTGELIFGFVGTSPRVLGDDAILWDTAAPATVGKRVGVVIQADVGAAPRSPDRFLGIHQNPSAAPAVTPVPTALGENGAISDDKQFYFASGADYSALNVNTGSASEKAAAQQKASQLWVTSVHETGADNIPGLSSGSKLMWDRIDWVLNNYNDNVFEWLDDRGFEFATHRRCGIGDVDLDLFYEHQFNDDAAGEVMIGVRFPTGASDNYCCNPYRAQMGNGEHWEIKLGGMIAWQPIDWLNVKVDGRYSFVLSDDERRMAAFKGACVKNIGPCVKAKVSWEYFVGTVDLNLFHPKTDAISFVLGYEFYYKTKDSIDFKCRTIESWLGNKWDSDTSAWVENKQTLDHCVAERYTDAITHKIRLETSFRINKYFELFCGGAYTIAGRNAPRDCDGFGGFVVTF